MTLQELYASIDGNSDHAVQIMRMDSKFPNSGVYEALAAAGESMDPTALFESAHAMKGVCANMGFDKMAAATNESVLKMVFLSRFAHIAPFEF